MNIYTKEARKYLKEATRNEFEKLIYNAKLTPTEEDIIRRHILQDKSVVAISLELNISERSVKKLLSSIYLKVSKCVYELSLPNLNTMKALARPFIGSA